MDNTWINIRIFYWHIQITKDRFWPKFSYNSYHRASKLPHGWFSVYNFFGYRS